MCGKKTVGPIQPVPAYLALLVFLLGLDQVLKYFARTRLDKIYLEKGDENPLFSFMFLCNEGVAFGLNFNKTLIIFLSALIIFSVLCLMWLGNFSAKEKMAWGVVVVGSLSNLLDRITLGCVIDYIKIYYWPVFNIADAMLVVAFIYLVIFGFKKSQVQEVC